MNRDPSATPSYGAPPPGAPTAVNVAPAYRASTAVAVPRDSVRWGPVWAGLLVAISSFLLLSLLALVIGVETVNRGAIDSEIASQTGAWVAAGLAVLAFLIGGFVAGRTSATRGRGSGLLNGFLVWALGIVLIAVLSAYGLGQLFGAIGDLFGQLRALTVEVGADIDRDQLAANVRSSALVAFLSMAIPAVAASVGGWLGARGRDEGDGDY